MLTTVSLGMAIFLLSCATHFFALSRLRELLLRQHDRQLGVIIVGVSGAALAHMIEAALYAVGFIVIAEFGLGGFNKEGTDSFMDVFYFSLVNYTSLGLGDIYPTGHSRFLAGLESLNGFLLISCSASFLFVLMQPLTKQSKLS